MGVPTPLLDHVSPLAHILVQFVLSIILVSITFSLRPDEAMLVCAWQKLVCAIKSFLLIAIQGVSVIIQDKLPLQKYHAEFKKCGLRIC